jgi:hypothetical protein
MSPKNLDDLGMGLLNDEAVMNSAECLREVEKLFKIPKHYRALLLKFGGTIFFDNGAKFKPTVKNVWTADDGYNSLDTLLGLGDGRGGILGATKSFQNRLPENWIPIGKGSGGNLICVHALWATVHYWDHEGENSECSGLIADSIDEFLASLEPDNEELPDDIDDWLDSSR